MPGVSNTEKERKHLSKKEFLYIALDTLSEQGQSQLHLHALIELMPVTSGSFYHHFKNKRDFLRQVIRYWEENGMQSVIDEVNRGDDQVSPQEKLWVLIKAIRDRKLNHYDRAVRSITMGDSELSGLVEAVDLKRLAFVERLFSEMGFGGAERKMRARSFLVTASRGFSPHQSSIDMDQETYLRRLHAFFIRR